MTELDYILEVHRYEEQRAESAFDLIVIGLVVAIYGVYRLIGWL